MANETQDATVKITDMIQDVTGALDRVVEVTGQMIEMIEGQNIATEKTAASFKTISDNTDNIFRNLTLSFGSSPAVGSSNTRILGSFRQTTWVL